MPELLRSARPCARKEHRCSACYGPIPVGTIYERDTLIYDGRVYDWLTCPPCEPLHVQVWHYAGCPDEGVGPSDYEDWAREYRDDPTHGPAARALIDRMGGESRG